MHTVEAKPSYETIPFPSYILRKGITSRSKSLLDSETSERPEPLKLDRKTIEQPESGLQRARKLALTGYSINVIVAHPSQGEIPRILALLGADPVFGHRKIIVPESVEHYKGWHWLARLTSITVFPIPTEASKDYFATKLPEGANREEQAKHKKMLRKKAKYEKLLRKKSKKYIKEHPEKEKLYGPRPMKAGQIALLENYLNGGLETLKTGNINLVFVQGGRQPYLKSITDVVSMLFERADKAGVDKFALMAIGVRIKDKEGNDVEDYGSDDVTGYNLKQKYIFTIGETLTSQEFRKRAQDHKCTLDELTFKQLEAVVPPSYKPRKIELP